MADPKEITKLSKTELLCAIRNKFGLIPSTQFLADEFNRRAHGSDVISREAFRKWLRGESIPSLDKIRILRGWLALDLDKLLD